MINLPPEFKLDRVLTTKQFAELLSLSIPHMRRLVREGKLPQPIRIGARKLGWKASTALDCVSSR
jgi:excisionase family DNA binding protein